MCLYLKSSKELKLAQEDITCYKYLVVEGDAGERLVPPYARLNKYCPTDFHYVLKRPYYGELGEVLDTIMGPIVEKGFHSFSTIPRPFSHWYMTSRVTAALSGLQLFKCIIPKGTNYYEGEWENGEGSYASDHIIIEEMTVLEEREDWIKWQREML